MKMETQPAGTIEIKERAKILLRWLAILPVFILTSVLIKAFTDFGAARYLSPEFVRKVVYLSDFSGVYYTIFGSLYLFLRELGSFYLALFFAVNVAPKFNKAVFSLLTGLWVLLLLISAYSLIAKAYPWSTGLVWQAAVEGFAQTCAVIAAGVSLFKGKGNNTKTES